MRSAKCVMKEGAHHNWEAPQYPFYIKGAIFVNCLQNRRAYRNGLCGNEYVPVRAMRCARRPTLRTTHFALRTISLCAIIKYISLGGGEHVYLQKKGHVL